MHQWSAFIIGLMAGANYYLYSELLVKMQIDDLLDAFPVHFGGGVVGLLMTPVFMYGGIIYSGGESGKITIKGEFFIIFFNTLPTFYKLKCVFY